MAKPIIDDELWRRLEPLLPQPKARREKYPGRKPVPDRAALNGIVFVFNGWDRGANPLSMVGNSGVWHTFIPGTDCRRWLFTICRNVFLRSRERQRPTVDLEDGEQDALAAGTVYEAARESGYGDLYARLDIGPALKDAIGELAEPFRSAVILVDVEDLSYESAAEVMGVPIGTVRSRLFRGRRLLQEKLASLAAEYGLAPTSAGSDR